MKTVEFTFEIKCDHSDESVENMTLLILKLFAHAGLEVQSNVSIPVGE